MFLLVPAHPGFPGQIPQSRKTVVKRLCVYAVFISYPQSKVTYPISTSFQALSNEDDPVVLIIISLRSILPPAYEVFHHHHHHFTPILQADLYLLVPIQLSFST